MNDLVEIYTNPLTPDRLERHAATALAEGGVERAQQALHAGMRNLIWCRNAFGLSALFARKERWAKYGGINPNVVFSKGSLLHYAVALPLLAQGREAIDCFGILLANGANPTQESPYCLYQENYRSGTADFHGSVVDYLQHLKVAVTRARAAGETIHGGGQNVAATLETIDYAISVAAPYLPVGYRPAPVLQELEAADRRKEAIIGAFYEASQSTGVTFMPEIVKTPPRSPWHPTAAND